MRAVTRLVLVGLIATTLFAAAVNAQEEEDADVSVDPSSDDYNYDEEAEDADGAAPSLGLQAASYFTKYGDMKIPAGERVEVLIPITSAAGNPAYEVVLVAGHLAMLDHSRYIQNFSVQTYQRTLEAGETSTIKYSITPDASLDPIEYALVIATYLRNEDNQTMLLAAYNGTVIIADPLGFDYQGNFTLLGLVAAIGGGLYYYFVVRAPTAPVKGRAQQGGRSRSSESTVAADASKSTEIDEDFIDKSHLAYLQSKKKNRSASPKNKAE